MHPKPPAAHYGLLNTIGVGCGTFNWDHTSIAADTQLASAFIFTDNVNLMGAEANMPKYKETVVKGKGKAKLFGRY